MRKSIPLLLLFIAVLLAGCLPQTQAATPTVTATRPVPVSTSALIVPTQANFQPDSGCTVVAKKPTPGATPQTIYPAITEQDWTKGPADAKVTILEYSDFQ
jgi:hypothetical protein